MMVVWSGGAPAQAQTVPPPVPAPQLPTRDQVQQPAPPLGADVSPKVRVDKGAAVATPPCPLADSKLTARIEQVTFVPVGRDTLPPAIAEALANVAPPAKGEQPIAAVCTIRDAANAALARAGYVASVQVPPQTITDGRLRLNVVLARIVEVRVHGEADRYRGVLTGAIARLRALDPLNERAAERILLLTGDVPGLEAQLALRPAGGAPGEVIGDLYVTTRRVSVLANVQNYGSRALGREVAYARVDMDAVFLQDDTLYVGGSTTAQTREQQVVQAGYRIGLPASGITFGPRVTYAWSRPDVGTLDLRSRSLIAGFDLAAPLLRSVRRNLSAMIGFEAIDQRIRVYDDTGSTPLNRDRLRVVYARLEGRVSGRRPDGLDAFALSGAVEVRKGLGIFGATVRGQTTDGYSPSRFEGDPQATVVRGSATGLVRLSRTFSTAHTAIAQWANHPLLNFEEQALGNLTVGLGYDPGANSADRFVGTHSELRADVPVLRGVAAQVYGFADNVWLWNLDPFSTETDRHLGSLGGGVRLRLPGPVLLDVGYARPFDRALAIDRARAPQRLLVSLTTQFMPRLF